MSTPSKRDLRRDPEYIKGNALGDALRIEHPTTRILTMSREQAEREGLEILDSAKDDEDDDVVRVVVITAPSMQTSSYTPTSRT